MCVYVQPEVGGEERGGGMKPPWMRVALTLFRLWWRHSRFLKYVCVCVALRVCVSLPHTAQQQQGGEGEGKIFKNRFI